jgi:predicted SAM-dependent methyltransferase
MAGCAEAAFVLSLRYPLSFVQTRFGRGKSRLQVGTGGNRFPGWYNGDITWNAEVIAYMGRRLPFADGSLAFIHCEHAIEHVPRDHALAFLREARRVLRPGGVCRIGTPDLAEMIDAYVADDWRKWSWVHEPGHRSVDSRARMVNACFYWWGHRFLYDRPELERLCREAGFERIEFVALGQSRHAELRNLETRENTNLIVEATKT